MHSKTGKDIISIIITAILLIAGNAWVWMSIQNGQIPPVEQLPLWGSFVVLNTISLLWAANALSLQPLVMGIAYLAGGFLAYRGVQGIENVNVAEITTAGAAYGAIGALAVGQISTKVCTVFSDKVKIPFYVVIIILLVVDGLLNSQILGSDLNIILNAVILPFVLSGVVLGMIWTGISYFISKEKPADDTASAATSSKKKTQPPKPAAKTTAKPATKRVQQQKQNKTPAKTKPLKKQQPAQASTSKPNTAPAKKPNPVLKTQSKPAPKIPTKPATNFAKKSAADEQFFPLEIDKDNDFVPPVEKKSPPPVKPKPVPPKPVTQKPIIPKPEPPKPAPETPKPASDSTNDWLSGHLDLLNKIDHDPKD